MALVVTDLPVLYLARQQKPLDDFPMPRLFKWFLLWIYDRYGFAATGYQVLVPPNTEPDPGKWQIIDYCSYEDRGVFTSEADARHAANCKGGSHKPVPLNAALPEETCRFGIHDFPQSENSHVYRRRRLPYAAVPTGKVELLDSIITERN